MSDDITALLISVKCRANSAKHFGADSLYIAVEQVQALIKALEAKQPHHNGMMQLSNELVMAKQRIAELESRTVTVKSLTPEVRYALKAEGLADVLKDAAEYAPLTAGQWETLTKNWHQTFIGLSGDGGI